MSSSLIKNPFSIYDFLGYFFPGAFLLCVFYLINSSESLSFDGIMKVFEDDKSFSISFSDSIIFIIISYILGHLLAYISSLTIERFSLWLFKYPSEFLLEDTTKKDKVLQNCNYWNRGVTSSGTINANSSSKQLLKIIRLLLKILLPFLLFPITICYLFSLLVNFKNFIIKPLDSYIVNSIKSKISCLLCTLQLSSPIDEDVDYSRIMSHYLIEHTTVHNVKLDNYIALYGFLRSITLVFNIITLYVVITSIVQCVICQNWIFILVLMAITFMFFLSFMKFYRRYTLEIFMCLITNDSIKCPNS